MPWSYFKDSLSSVVLRCGPSLMEFTSTVPLSDTAVNHLIQLPHLRAWSIGVPPPTYSVPSLPLIFPPLTESALWGDAVSGWLPFFRRLEHEGSAAQGVAPLSMVKGSLESLEIEQFPDPIIDTSFVFTIQTFRNLVNLNVTAKC